MEKNNIPLILNGIVARGHRVASGMAEDNPFGKSTITLQKPHFEKLGIPLSHFYSATINVDISPKSFDLIGCDYDALKVNWTDIIPPEDFFFSHCKLIHNETAWDAMIYRPSPETKVDQFQPASIVEILAPKITGLEYNDPIVMELNTAHCLIT